MKNVLSGGSMGYIEAILGYPHPDSSRSSELAPSNYLTYGIAVKAMHLVPRNIESWSPPPGLAMKDALSSSNVYR
jgi:hypothetical protein